MGAFAGAVFMVDASSDFRKDGPKNRLRERDIQYTYWTGSGPTGGAVLKPDITIQREMEGVSRERVEGWLG